MKAYVIRREDGLFRDLTNSKMFSDTPTLFLELDQVLKRARSYERIAQFYKQDWPEYYTDNNFDLSIEVVELGMLQTGVIPHA